MFCVVVCLLLHLLSGIANEDGELYRFGLDGRGDVVDEWGFDGLHRHYERDGVGRVSKVLRPDERWSAYEYDGTGHIVSERHSDGSEAAYKYNKDGLLVAAFNDATRVGLVRGRDGRVLQETQGEHRVESHYDAYGSRIRLCSDLGADIALQYDTEGQLSGMQSAGWEVAIGRDKSGLEIQRELSGGVKISSERDMLGRVTEQSIFSGSVEKSRMRFHWDMGNRLLHKTNLLTGESVQFDYDPWDNLFKADYKDGEQVETLYKAPDAIGNLFRTPERKDCKYGKGGRLLEDKKYTYHYDGEGNLVLKSRLCPEAPKTPLWQEGDWAYEWMGNGMLRSVRRPDGEVVSFEYDPLGRRISKTFQGKTTRWVWDGNVPLHEWTDTETVTTWLFDEGTFIPTAKIVGDKSYSIVTDYLGTPTHAFDSNGAKVWERNLDIYGRVKVGDSTFVPFQYQGQYFDEETDLCYNRFRYYSPNEGMYISQDPIGVAGGNPNIYAYVSDTNSWIDAWGLDVYKLIATSDGWYPVFQKGHTDPIAYTRLKKGDIYKIGESQRSAKRYSSTRMDEARINRSKATSYSIDTEGIINLDETSGLKMEFISQGGTKDADRLLETQEIKKYERTHNELPPGNKTHH